MPPPQPCQQPPGGGTKYLTETLLLTTAAATTRTDEATLMFGPVASALDEATRGASAPVIPHHLVNTYQQFIERTQSVAQEFFDNYVRRVPNTTTLLKGVTKVRDLPASRQPQHLEKPPHPSLSPPGLQQHATERLLSPHPLLHYRKFLGTNAALLKEVQHVPSDLPLRPSSADAVSRLESLFSEGIKEGKLLGATTIEKALNLVSYLLTSIPRTFTALNENNQLTNYPITEDLIRAELMEEKGLTPVSVHETKGSIESSYYSLAARYIACFPFGTNLPRKFYLFGVAAAVFNGITNKSVPVHSVAASVARLTTLSQIINRAALTHITVLPLDVFTVMDLIQQTPRNVPFDPAAMEQL
ncbi:hypothetical protein K3495_g10639 [Podosphaera aphanis]|nr:hypothetical protein K3495_g10639 [Podosphaera aphanis]